MRPRQDITEMFSTFVELEGDRFSKWSTDRVLVRSMQHQLENSPEVPKMENFWALYWYKQWLTKEPKSSSIAKMHLLAYLQEPCYQVSQKMSVLAVNNQYSIADFFQMANAEVETILQNFNPRKSSSLKAYFTMAIKSRLKDILRQQKEGDFASNWALLRKVSKKLFIEALENAGLSAKEIAQYLLAWTYFKQLYLQPKPVSAGSLTRPSTQLWNMIANLYNDSRHQLTPPTPECTAQTIENWLNQSVIHLRAYLFPSVKSLDNFNTDDGTEQTLNLKEKLPDPSSDLSLNKIIAAKEFQEQQIQTSQMIDMLSQALRTLDVKSQKILKLYYQEKLTQREIMQELQMSQPTVSRKLVKGRESLLKALVVWSQELNISVKPNQIKDMSIALEEFWRNRDFFGE